jgi:osmotically-inducible protein OsmY
MKLKLYRKLIFVPLLAPLIVSPIIGGCASVPAAAVIVSGATVGYVMIQSNKRTFKEYWNDNQLDRAITRAIKNDQQLITAAQDVIHVNVAVFNEIVLLTGEVPLQNQIARMIDIANSFSASRQVINRIELAGKSNLNSRVNDTLLTTQVRAALLDSEYLDGHKIKVVTERANVYLLGTVTREEADIAAQIARSISGVVRVVKVFEYL